MISFSASWRRLTLSVFALTAVSRAAPSAEEIKLAKKYAPLWKFHQAEIYFPSTVEYFLSGPVKALDADGKVIIDSPNTENLDDPPNQGADLYLTTDIENGKKDFLRGKNPSTYPSSSNAYTFVSSKPNNIVDIFYWLYTPFNHGKDTFLGVIGDHVSDWEYMAIRTVNGEATLVDYHAHDEAGTGVVPWSQAPKFDNGERPVGYVANGSHGFWNAAGTFTYLQIGNIKLQDVTSDGGASWDVQNDLKVYKYPDTFTDTDGWINYKGRWGNQASPGCGVLCEIVDGPFGPYRPDVFDSAFNPTTPADSGTKSLDSVMSGRLTHTVGLASAEGSSTFSVYVEASQYIDAKYIVVQKQCGPSSSNTRGTNLLAQRGVGTSNLSSSTPFVRGTKIMVSVDACTEGNVVISYVLGLCKDDKMEDCAWGGARALRAFSANPSVPGIQDTKAINVEDLDVWRW